MKTKKMTHIRRRDAIAVILGAAGAFIMSSSVYASKGKLSQRINKITNNKEIGRIKGYTNPEMFWWQVDEITEK